MSDRHFIHIPFVYFRLNMPRGSIRETEQWARSDGAERFAAPGVDSQYGSVDWGDNGALPDPLLGRANATLRRLHLCIRAGLVFLQRRRGQQLLSPNSGLQISIRDAKVADSLLISGPGNLLPLKESALHLHSRLSLFKCCAGGCCLFSGYFLFLVTRTAQKPGPCLARAIRFGHRSL